MSHLKDLKAVVTKEESQCMIARQLPLSTTEHDDHRLDILVKQVVQIRHHMISGTCISKPSARLSMRSRHGYKFGKRLASMTDDKNDPSDKNCQVRDDPLLKAWQGVHWLGL